jgi:hypothetical protein
MKTILFTVLMFSFFFAKSQNGLDNLLFSDMSYQTFSSISSIKTIRENEDQKVKITEWITDTIKSGSSDSLVKITFFFLDDVLAVYTITFRDNKKPSIESLCKIWGECTQVGKYVFNWKSNNGKVEAYSNTENKNEIIITFGKRIYTASK